MKTRGFLDATYIFSSELLTENNYSHFYNCIIPITLHSFLIKNSILKKVKEEVR